VDYSRTEPGDAVCAESSSRWFDADPRSIGEAREFVGRFFSLVDPRPCDAGLSDDARLIVSELATNALRHVGQKFQVLVEVHRDGPSTWVRVAVRDQDPTPPTRCDPTSEAVSGRGLTIIDLRSDRWGHELLPDGHKIVFAEMSRHAG
jgi:anti-sigma regulatory factor (Ser/Thr protein kinase)